ncbi:Uncharacterised protein [Vibrio cholerae]|nr:Uncharacterised protein [Vibrio cholerae]CSD98173.1 Uncharacterised protein [Vibrio cholerae]CSI53494.1 Uncharacterised protein [Vibrio cholerae]
MQQIQTLKPPQQWCFSVRRALPIYELRSQWLTLSGR